MKKIWIGIWNSAYPIKPNIVVSSSVIKADDVDDDDDDGR